MAILKCKMCGGDLTLTDGASVAECEYCGTTQTVPTLNNEKKLNLFARANRLRAACEFDKAAGVYESIVSEFNEEAEAYWGLILCKYGIEYVDDPATGKKIPTCHRSSFECVLDDHNFELVMENADTEARKVYREEAKAIEELRKGIVEVSSKEEPYDIFICYKETAKDGQRTLDSVMAQDIYDALTEKGYRVFFSRVTLEDKLGQEYEPYIFAALQSAKVMLAVGTDYEHYNAVWVKNEWSRFLQLIASGQKKHLIPCFKGIDAYDMPKEFTRLQAQDLGKVGAMQDLLRGIEKLLPKNQTQAVVRKNSVSEVDRLVQNGEALLKVPNYDNAYKIFETVSYRFPKDYRGWWGMITCKTMEFTDKDYDYKKLSSWFSHVQKLTDGELLEELTQTFKNYIHLVANKEVQEELGVLQWEKEQIDLDLRPINSKISEEKVKKQKIESKYREELAKIKEACLKLSKEISEYQNSAPEGLWNGLMIAGYISYAIAVLVFLFSGADRLGLAILIGVAGVILQLISAAGEGRVKDNMKEKEIILQRLESKKEEEKTIISKRTLELEGVEPQLTKLEDELSDKLYWIEVIDRYLNTDERIRHAYWFSSVCADCNLVEPCEKEIIDLHRLVEKATVGELRRPAAQTVTPENSAQAEVKIDRSQDEICCPACGTKQKSNRKICFHCGVVFLNNR